MAGNFFHERVAFGVSLSIFGVVIPLIYLIVLNSSGLLLYLALTPERHDQVEFCRARHKRLRCAPPTMRAGSLRTISIDTRTFISIITL